MVLILSLLGLYTPSQYFGLLDSPDIFRFIKRLIHFTIDPGAAFSPYGFTPRNNLSILVLAVFILRWSGKHKLVYLCILPLYFIHSTMTLLLIIHIVALDIFKQRSILRDTKVLLCLFSGMAYGLWRESLWPTVAGSLFTQLILLCMLLLFLALVFLPDIPAVIHKISPGLSRRIITIHTRLRTLSAPVSDLVLLLFIWLITIPLAWLVSSHMTDMQNFYFWHQVHGRAIGLFQPVICVTLAYAFLTSIAEKYFSRTLGILLAIWIAVFSWQLYKQPSPLASLRKELHQLEDILSGKNNTLPFRERYVLNEHLVYYTLGQMLTLHNDRRDDLWNTARKGTKN
jgi:hypothetical protein